jgi:hypothetical protein
MATQIMDTNRLIWFKSVDLFPIRVVNFKSDEKSDWSIDIFSTNQNAPL